ncbi:hypothetical protein [Mucilaginibacter xinganensis]|uniref:Uncharacterized protein n=1 Tax=Mucilaginibacter xinganensis TaxID=1234841 RepID=A0A223NX35_9SPHI|nr:hypothetical protein [Mucilaginibacter xinganensis]ASU34350.1 hypothetical protein MuYL_2463 [Mucilaginibacter xinganensis]
MKQNKKPLKNALNEVLEDSTIFRIPPAPLISLSNDQKAYKSYDLQAFLVKKRAKTTIIYSYSGE